jgi:hypothetical protein
LRWCRCARSRRSRIDGHRYGYPELDHAVIGQLARYDQDDDSDTPLAARTAFRQRVKAL